MHAVRVKKGSEHFVWVLEGLQFEPACWAYDLSRPEPFWASAFGALNSRSCDASSEDFFGINYGTTSGLCLEGAGHKLPLRPAFLAIKERGRRAFEQTTLIFRIPSSLISTLLHGKEIPHLYLGLL